MYDIPQLANFADHVCCILHVLVIQSFLCGTLTIADGKIEREKKCEGVGVVERHKNDVLDSGIKYLCYVFYSLGLEENRRYVHKNRIIFM